MTVVIVACGHIGNEPELYINMVQNPNSPAPPPPFRFFTVGIDFNVSVPFLRRVAGWSRGRYFQLASDEAVDQAALDDHLRALVHTE